MDSALVDEVGERARIMKSPQNSRGKSATQLLTASPPPHPPPQFLETLSLHSLERWHSGLQTFWQLFHTLLAPVLVSEPLQVDVKSEQEALSA